LDDGSQPSWLARASRLGHALENGLLVVLLSFLVVFSIGVTWGDGLTRIVVSGSRCSVHSRRAATGSTFG